MASPPWLPTGDLDLERSETPEVRPHRPYVQGDVFIDVPIATTPRDAVEPKIVKGAVILLGHPCSIYRGSSPYHSQFVASVRSANDAAPGRPFSDPWDSHLYLFPLPGLRDGADWAADFTRVGTTHYKNLENRRVACLSHGGWAALQRRWAWHTIRADLPLAQRESDISGYWYEMHLWETWNDRGNPPDGFQAWLDRPSEADAFVGTTRRELLDFAPGEIEDEIPRVD